MKNFTKICKDCKQDLPFEEFYKHKKTKDGRQPYCKICSSARRRARYAANSESEKIRNNAWNKANPDRMKAINKKWRKSHPEEAVAKSKAWAQANPELVSATFHKRRVTIKGNKVFVISKKEMCKLYSSSCIYCGSDKNIQADHVIPVSRGGDNSIGNLVPACRSCNASKSNKTIMEWKITT